MAVALRPLHHPTPQAQAVPRHHGRDRSYRRPLDGGRRLAAQVCEPALAGAIPDSDLFGVRVRQAPHYRRRRFAAFVLVVVALYATWSVLSFGMSQLVTPANASEVPVFVEPTVHVVAPGETMWSIAASLDSDRPVPALVDDLAAANGGVGLLPGQRLVIDVALD